MKSEMAFFCVASTARPGRVKIEFARLKGYQMAAVRSQREARDLAMIRCDICGRVNMTEKYRKYHCETECGNAVGTIMCGICTKSPRWTSVKERTLHYRDYHADEQTAAYWCPCGEAISGATRVRDHLLVCTHEPTDMSHDDASHDDASHDDVSHDDVSDIVVGAVDSAVVGVASGTMSPIIGPEYEPSDDAISTQYTCPTPSDHDSDLDLNDVGEGSLDCTASYDAELSCAADTRSAINAEAATPPSSKRLRDSESDTSLPDSLLDSLPESPQKRARRVDVPRTTSVVRSGMPSSLPSSLLPGLPMSPSTSSSPDHPPDARAADRLIIQAIDAKKQRREELAAELARFDLEIISDERTEIKRRMEKYAEELTRMSEREAKLRERFDL
jgi:hypothetical protein